MFQIKEESCTMEVNFSEEEVSYSFYGSVDCESQTVKTEYRMKINMKNIDEIKERFYEDMDNKCDIHEIESLGQLLYQQLVPKSLAEIILSRKGNIIIVTKRQDIPWEMLHDGENFWGLKYGVGRCIVGCNNKTIDLQKNDNAKEKRKTACLIVTDPTGDLKEAEIESQELMEFLREKNIACSYITKQQVTVSDLLMEFNSSKYDFIHYNGHIGKDSETGEFSFILSGGKTFSLNSVSVLENFGNPFVFLNGCGDRVNSINLYGGGFVNEGIVVPFIYAGARVVIGSSWRISDKGAKVFAESIYNHLLSGETIGRAMTETRIEMKQKYSTNTDWAAFNLYGNPGLCFLNGLNFPNLPGKLKLSDFTDKGVEVIKTASGLLKKSSLISTTHLFYSVISQNKELAIQTSYALKVPSEEIINIMNEIIDKSENYPAENKELKKQFSMNCEKVLITAEVNALKDNNKIGPDEIYSSLLTLEKTSINMILMLIVQNYYKKTKNELFDNDILIKEIFSKDSFQCIQSAAVYTQGKTLISTTHLFLSILSAYNYKYKMKFKENAIDISEIEKYIMKIIGIDVIVPPEENIFSKNIYLQYFSENTIEIICAANKNLKNKNCKITNEDILQCILSNKCSATQIIKNCGINPLDILSCIEKFS